MRTYHMKLVLMILYKCNYFISHSMHEVEIKIFGKNGKAWQYTTIHGKAQQSKGKSKGIFWTTHAISISSLISS